MQFFPIICFSLFILAAAANGQTKRPEDITGKIDRDHFQWVIALRANNKKYDPSMKAVLQKVLSTATAVPVLNPPKGFDISVHIGAVENNKGPDSGLATASIDMMCFNYAKNTDGAAGFHKQDESHGGLNIAINDLHASYHVDYYTSIVCADIHYPDIFFLPEISKVSESKLLIDKNFMVLKKPDRPVFTPLTRQEYDEFMIKKIQYDFDNTIYPAEKGKIKKLLQQYQSALQALSQKERNAPAYVTEDLSHHYADYDYFYKPASASSGGAKIVYRVNPDYYDPSLSKTTIQLMVIHYHASHFCPDFERQALEKWFRQIDYKKLQVMIK